MFKVVLISFMLICRCFVWDDVVIVAGSETGDAVIIQLHPSPKILTTFGKSSGIKYISCVLTV